jgi:hypothetical protein
MRTEIFWSLNNFCKAQCTYCPSKFWGGDTPHHISDYLEITKKIIDHYTSLGRKIDWEFNGGEPLDMFDFPMLLKLCKEQDCNIILNSNGGKIWLDWWAIEPHVDVLNLTYHYWQKSTLIKFILDIFKSKNKIINVKVPIRPDFFEEDMQRALSLEHEYEITVGKIVLYNHADQAAGMFPYTNNQLAIISGIKFVDTPVEIEKTEDTIDIVETLPLVIEKKHFEKTTFKERFEEKMAANLGYTGMLCNSGIEFLSISHEGWATGSACNNRPLGNIWDPNFVLPNDPHTCSMMHCISPRDQKITKFKST